MLHVQPYLSHVMRLTLDALYVLYNRLL
eukprot:SAG31_NODE_37795_length_301_cov_1.019802_1_plen_27_part_01